MRRGGVELQYSGGTLGQGEVAFSNPSLAVAWMDAQPEDADVQPLE